METTQVPAQKRIDVKISFYSYFKELTGCVNTSESLIEGDTLEVLFEKLIQRYPRLAAMRKSTLIAVGLDYQDRAYVLKAGDEVSLFPPVQGG